MLIHSMLIHAGFPARSFHALSHHPHPRAPTPQVLFNILKAHAAAYKAMKSIPSAEDIQIGLVHHHVEFMPTSPKFWWVKPLAWWGTFWWGRDTVLRFLQTGEFEWWVPLWGRSALFSAPTYTTAVCQRRHRKRTLLSDSAWRTQHAARAVV